MTERDIRRLASEVATCATLTMPKEIEDVLSDDDMGALLSNIEDLVYATLEVVKT
jgi:hypothetical protein